MPLEIDLLGHFSVRRDGAQVGSGEFGGQLAQRLIRMLVTRRGQMLTRDVLIDALWGDDLPADPDANLNVLVNRARGALGNAAAIETVTGGYLFSESVDVTVDVEQFGAHLRAARQWAEQAADAQALVEVKAALVVWRGEPLPEDTYAEWAQSLRDRLERAHQEALELGARAALAVDDIQEAGDRATEAVANQPLREAAHLLKIRALAASGDTAAALAAYEALRDRLVEELGIDPSREAAGLYLGLIEGDTGAGRATTDLPALAGPSPSHVSPLVGREQELTRLSSIEPGRQVGLIAGRSGSGKSRLLAELAELTDLPVLSARALLPEQEAPWSLARSLLRAVVETGVDPRVVLPPRSSAALADLLPEFGDGTESDAVDAQSRRALALEGAVRLLAETRPALMIVDDLQWADPSSLGLLAAVASRAEQMTIVLAYRPEEVPDDDEVASFFADLRATTATVNTELRPLDVVAMEQLVPDHGIAVLLASDTDGTPFAVLEVLRTLEEQGVLRREGAVWHPVTVDALDRAQAEARAGQRRSVVLRADRQPRSSRELVDLLALLGRPASADLLADATGTGTAEIGSTMSRLARAELVRHDQHGWAVAHDLVGDTMQDHLDPSERGRLHQLLARALEGTEGAVGERARHLAGAGDWPGAAVEYAKSSRQRLEHSADREAERLAQAGLDLEPADPTRAALLEVRAETRFRVGDLSGARADLRTALALAEAGDERARLLARLASLESGAEDLVRASNLVDLALAEAGEEAGPRARALAVGAIIDMNLERPQQSEARYDEALSLFERVGDARGIADVLDARAMATFLAGDITGGVAAFDRVAHLFADVGNLLRVVTPRSTRGHGLLFAGAPQAALAEITEALELARSLGNPEGQTYALWHRSEALTGCGRHAEAAEAATEALAIAERLDHRGWTATALRAQGVAHQAGGDLVAAERAFRRSCSASDHLPLFASWALARLGLVLVATDRLDEAAEDIGKALSTGPPLGHYEARLARCELAAARKEAGTVALIDDATGRASSGGHRACLPRLAVLRTLANARTP